jgi:DegV family protein with EDD domain
MTVHILTDSTSDLGEELLGRYGIEAIPLHVTIGAKEYLDGIDIQQEKLFSMVSEVGTLPKTAAPSIGEFEEYFSRSGDSLFIGISSKLSATVQNARLAGGLEADNRVRIVDSLSLSTGIGLLVLRAAEMSAIGTTVTEIEGEINALVPKVRASFMIDTMDYLYKGGRCSALQAIAGSMLKIHPIIHVRADGTLGVKEKARGTRQKGLNLLLDDYLSHVDETDKRRVFVTHTTSPEDAQYLKDEIIKRAAPKEVHITHAGSVIASHCGPGTIGILYLMK